jgi:peptidoglycan/xylan/chitin deacetylase (PgdA/CDA1 family)
VPIITLEYHDVVPAGDWDSSGYSGLAAASYKLSSERFSQHLDAIAASRRTVGVPVHRALAGSAPDCILLTFDDGGTSVHLIARLLGERGWKGHFFIPTDYMGTAAFAGGDVLRELHAAGHVIGSHSATHPTNMNRMPAAMVREEWRRSVGVLEDVLGARVAVASVPGGAYRRSVAEAAREAGIAVLFTSEPVTAVERVSSCAVMGRYTLRQSHPAAYVSRLVGPAPSGRFAQWLHWNARKLGKRVGGGAYAWIREAWFSRISR